MINQKSRALFDFLVIMYDLIIMLKNRLIFENTLYDLSYMINHV